MFWERRESERFVSKEASIACRYHIQHWHSEALFHAGALAKLLQPVPRSDVATQNQRS